LLGVGPRGAHGRPAGAQQAHGSGSSSGGTLGSAGFGRGSGMGGAHTAPFTPAASAEVASHPGAWSTSGGGPYARGGGGRGGPHGMPGRGTHTGGRYGGWSAGPAWPAGPRGAPAAPMPPLPPPLPPGDGVIPFPGVLASWDGTAGMGEVIVDVSSPAVQRVVLATGIEPPPSLLTRAASFLNLAAVAAASMAGALVGASVSFRLARNNATGALEAVDVDIVDLPALAPVHSIPGSGGGGGGGGWGSSLGGGGGMAAPFGFPAPMPHGGMGMPMGLPMGMSMSVGMAPPGTAASLPWATHPTGMGAFPPPSSSGPGGRQ